MDLLNSATIPKMTWSTVAFVSPEIRRLANQDMASSPYNTVMTIIICWRYMKQIIKRTRNALVKPFLIPCKHRDKHMNRKCCRVHQPLADAGWRSQWQLRKNPHIMSSRINNRLTSSKLIQYIWKYMQNYRHYAIYINWMWLNQATYMLAYSKPNLHQWSI